MQRYSQRRLVWAGLTATLAAILADVLYFALSKALGEPYLMPLDGSSFQLGPMQVLTPVLAVLISGWLATILFGLLLRFVRKPATVFLSISIAALILSFGGPFNLPSATMQLKLLLTGMHVIAAGIITGGILLMSRKNSKVP